MSENRLLTEAQARVVEAARRLMLNSYSRDAWATALEEQDRLRDALVALDQVESYLENPP